MSVAKEKDQPGHPATKEDLEAELEQIRSQLSERSSNRGFVLLAAFFAVLLSMSALLGVAFKVQDNNDASQAMHNRMSDNAGAASGAPAAGAPAAGMPAADMPGMSGGAESATSGAGAVPQVRVDLGDFWARPDVSSAPAGKIEFVARNVGKVEHELMVERMPIEMDGPGQPNEEAAQGMIEDMEPGESGRMTLDLSPGTYMLFCNVPGHYAAGQHTMFRVTR